MGTLAGVPYVSRALAVHRRLAPRLVAAGTVLGLLLAAGSWLAHPLAPIGVGVLALTFVVVSLAWPTDAVLASAIVPLLIRGFLVYGLPPASRGWANVLSNALIGVAVVVVGGSALASGRWRRAAVHPVTLGMIAFVVLGGISALVNAVPPKVAVLGTVATVDTFAIFVLALVVPWTKAHVVRGLAALTALLVVAAVIAVLQETLTPNIFGLKIFVGRFGEGGRPGSVFVNPNLFSSIIELALGFTIAAACGLRWTRRQQVAVYGVSGLLGLAMVLAHSRGAWAGMLLGMALIGWHYGRRAVAGLLIGTALVVGLSVALPTNLLHTPGQDIISAVPPPSTPGRQRPQGLLASTVNRVQAVFTGKDLRTQFIANGLPILADHPVLGVGPGRYGGAVAHATNTPIYRQYGTDQLLTSKIQTTVDDFWLHLIVEAGVLGFLAFFVPQLLLVLLAVRLARRVEPALAALLFGAVASVLAFWFDNTTTIVLEGNYVSPLYWLIMGMVAVLVTRSRTPQAPEVGTSPLLRGLRDWLPPGEPVGALPAEALATTQRASLR